MQEFHTEVRQHVPVKLLTAIDIMVLHAYGFYRRRAVVPSAEYVRLVIPVTPGDGVLIAERSKLLAAIGSSYPYGGYRPLWFERLTTRLADIGSVQTVRIDLERDIGIRVGDVLQGMLNSPLNSGLRRIREYQVVTCDDYVELRVTPESVFIYSIHDVPDRFRRHEGEPLPLGAMA